MDDTDRKLLLLISEDPRMPLKELSRRLGITRQAVSQRLQVLTKLGIFKSIKAEISIHWYGSLIFPLIWGVSKTTSIDKTLDRLGESEFTTSAAVFGGGMLSVFGCVRNELELNDFIDFVKRVAEMPDPTVGLIDTDDGVNHPTGRDRSDRIDDSKQKRNRKELSSLDLRIIASLHDDARRPVAEIADALGTSVKTIRRHIERMRTEGSLDFHVPYDFPPGEDMFTVLLVNLRGGADKVEVGRRLLSRYPLRVIVVRSFTNIPHFLRILLSSDDMGEIRMIVKEIREDEDVASVTPNLIYDEREYETAWDWEMLRTLASSFKNPGIRPVNPDSASDIG